MAERDTELLGNQIEHRYGFGDGMFDLQARIHLKEIELSRAVNELDRAGVVVTGRARNPGSSLADLHALIGAEARRRGLLDDLLKAALDGAFPLKNMNHVAMHIPQDLHFDVAGPLDVALNVEPSIAKVTLSLTASANNFLIELCQIANNVHPLAAAPR